MDCSKGDGVKETTRNLGLITVLTREQRRRYAVTAALDQSRHQWLTAAEAAAQGITDADNNTYRTSSGEYIDMQVSECMRVSMCVSVRIM